MNLATVLILVIAFCRPMPLLQGKPFVDHTGCCTHSAPFALNCFNCDAPLWYYLWYRPQKAESRAKQEACASAKVTRKPNGQTHQLLLWSDLRVPPFSFLRSLCLFSCVVGLQAHAKAAHYPSIVLCSVWRPCQPI